MPEPRRTAAQWRALLAERDARLAEREREVTRLGGELQERLEEQTATAEVLRVISESPTDLRPALDAICASAARLCGAPDVTLVLYEGATYRAVAGCGPLPKRILDDGLPRPVDRRDMYG